MSMPYLSIQEMYDVKQRIDKFGIKDYNPAPEFPTTGHLESKSKSNFALSKRDQNIEATVRVKSPGP